MRRSGEFLRFSAVGAFGFAVDAVVFALMNSALDFSIPHARLLSTVCAVSVTWGLNRRLTFPHRRSPSRTAEFVRYAMGQLTGLVVNLAVFALALWSIPALREWPIAALAIGSAVALAFNYSTARLFVFRGEQSAR